jgi:hypothetical protein
MIIQSGLVVRTPSAAIAIAFCMLLHSCTFTYRSAVNCKLQATIQKSTGLPQLPSGSAIQIKGDSVYIISDDAPYFYRCGLEGMPVESIRLLHLPDAERRIPKPVKPDYEAAILATVEGRECLIAFGSGSLRPQRDSGLIVSLTDPDWQRVVPLNALYAAMRAQAGLAEADFNIEASALRGDQLLLFNRGSNHVFFMDWPAVLEHLLSGRSLPRIRSSALPLPKVKGYPIGISDACFLDARHVLFCASVEATTSWVRDGAVLGSYVGIIALGDDGKPDILDLAPVMNKTGDTVKDKVEGIYYYGPKKNTGLGALGIVDNDDGSSRLLRISLSNMPF